MNQNTDMHEELTERLKEFLQIRSENPHAPNHIMVDDKEAPLLISALEAVDSIKSEQEIKEIILEEYKNGNIVVYAVDGLQTMPIKEFIKQPAAGMLYDLNRGEAVVLTFLPDPKWINDYAVAKVIRELKTRIEELESLNTDKS